jgi:transcriptional regulator with XRE-family HTH domain
MCVGLKIRKLRQAKGIKQEELAGAIKISQGTLSKMESGCLSVSTSALFAIAKYTETSMAYFLSESEPEDYAPRPAFSQERLNEMEERISDLRAHNAELRERIQRRDLKIETLKKELLELREGKATVSEQL